MSRQSADCHDCRYADTQSNSKHGNAAAYGSNGVADNRRNLRAVRRLHGKGEAAGSAEGFTRACEMIDEKRKQLILDYRTAFGTDAGQRVYYHLSQVNFYSASFVTVMAGSPQQIAFELGKREAFIQIMEMMKADPDRELQEVAETEEFDAGG